MPGRPIRDPFTGRIEGVLDISCLSQHSTPIMHSLVRSAARRIEHNLLLDRNQLQQALFDAYSRVDARSRQAVLAVGLRVVMANPPMQALLEPGDQEALQDHVRFLMLRHATVDEPVELPSGILVRLRGSAVRLGTETAGMIGVVSLLNGVDGPAATAAPPGRPPPRASPTPNRVLHQPLPRLVRGGRQRAGGVGSGRADPRPGRTGYRPVHASSPSCTGSATAWTGPSRSPAGEIEAAPAEIAARLLRPAAEPRCTSCATSTA